MLNLYKNVKLLVRLGEHRHYRHFKNWASIKTVCSANDRTVFCGEPLKKYFTTKSTVQNEEVVEPDVNAITEGNPELENKLKVLILEVEVMRQDGRNMPTNPYLKTHHWQELLKLGSRSARGKYLDYLFKTEKKKVKRELKKEQTRLENEQNSNQEVDTGGHLRYDLGHNNIFLRFYDSTVNHFYHGKLIEAMQFGQKLVVDCGYDSQMTTRENLNCAKQLMFLFSDNRIHKNPFDLHFCNANLQSTLMKGLHRHIATLYEPWFPLHVHENSYTDIFPKEQLVYLTPHCREEMKCYDHDAIYIIGGIVDKANNQPLSMARAKQEGLRMVKFPLDHYLQWGSGSGKSLTLNQVISILLDVKVTGDWKYALRHVPRRKIIDISGEISSGNTLTEKNRDFGPKRVKPNKYDLKYNNKQRRLDRTNDRMLRVNDIFNE